MPEPFTKVLQMDPRPDWFDRVQDRLPPNCQLITTTDYGAGLTMLQNDPEIRHVISASFNNDFPEIAKKVQSLRNTGRRINLCIISGQDLSLVTEGLGATFVHTRDFSKQPCPLIEKLGL